jgi:hypothetical protein
VDSLAWSKKYEVLSISRLYLRSLGVSNEGITSFTYDDMQRIADSLHHDYVIGFEEDLKFVIACELADKEKLS